VKGGSVVKRPVILSAVRTAGGKFGGSLAAFEAPEPGAVAVAEAVKRAGVAPDAVGEVIMGNGWQAGVGPNPARIAVVKSGLPVTVPAFTVNIRCGSSLRALMLVCDRIRLGDIAVGVGGGMESASNVPYLLKEARWGHRMGDKTSHDSLHRDGFMCPLAGMMMGATAEILAEEYKISREEQDSYALESHRRAVAAMESGKFKGEVVPVKIKSKKEEIAFDTEEIPRRDTSLEKLAKLPPIYKEGGTITAGTSSALCDAGSAVVVADADWARANGAKPMAEVLGYDVAACEPDRMGMGPVYAVPKALQKANLSLEDIDLIELNEAFAAQVLAVQKAMSFDMSKCNVHGGAIALGHPIGATGTKILATLLYALKTYDKELGLATACIGGGQGVAMVVRRLS
jgi:acetyl-CoA C-acetyltransferase